jgi:hypothetical protein
MICLASAKGRSPWSCRKCGADACQDMRGTWTLEKRGGGEILAHAMLGLQQTHGGGRKEGGAQQTCTRADKRSGNIHVHIYTADFAFEVLRSLGKRRYCALRICTVD